MFQVKNYKLFYFYFISMATNYTTKTAALKATKADMRQVAVSKKIEIGSTDTKTIIQDGEVSAEDLLIGVDVEKDGVKTRERQSVKTLINKAAESAAISVGRDADKNWSVDDVAIAMVKKISFLGDYVNVVEGENNEVKLYIGENKSLPEANKTAISGVPSTNATVVVYEDATDDFALPTAANGSTTSAWVVKDGSNFGTKTLTAKSVNDTETFTLDSSDCIWVRATYEGTATSWGKVSLKKNRGTYNNGGSNPTASSVSKVAFSADAEAGEVALPSGITMTVGNYVLTAENDAKNGKVPGRCETAFDITIDFDAIATKDGGTVKIEWAISASEPTAPNSFSLFLSEYKDVAMASGLTASIVGTPTLTSAVSGLKYVTSGTKVKVSTGNITNSQYKTAASKKRLNITAGGKSVDYNNSDLTLVSGTITKSDAVYKATDKEITLSTTGTGTAEVKATPYGYAAGDAQTTTIANFWGSVPTSTATKENFGVETTYRMLTPTSAAGSYPNTEDVTTHDVDVNGTSCVSAVCQYGKLYHPASAAADAEGTSYTTTKPACFIRTFTGSSKPNTFKLEGINLIQSGKVQIWWKDGNNWYDLSTAVSGSVAHSDKSAGSADTITKTIKTADGETSRTDMLIAIVVQPGASYIGPITATFA